MKITAITIASALMLAPAMSFAQQTTRAAPPAEEPEAGGVAQGPLPVFGSLPVGTVVVGGFVVLAATGVIVGILARDDGNVAISTSGTN